MLSSKAENAIKLAIIAALADGWTDYEELAVAVSEIAETFGEDLADLAAYTVSLVDEYVKMGLDQDKSRAVIAAIEALQALGIGDDSNDAWLAVAVARNVVRADGYESGAEQDFLGLLSQILGIAVD